MSTLIELVMSLFQTLYDLLFPSKPPVAAQAAAPAPVVEEEEEEQDEDEDEEEEEEEEDEDEVARTQAFLDQQMAAMQGMMNDAVDQGNSPLLEPIDGVSVETWATIAAALTTLGNDPDAYHRLLAEHDLDAARYETAQQKWTERMSSVEDPMAAAAISQIYGKAFTTARTGAADGAPAGDEPCSFDRFCELMGAQAAWAEDGLDVNAQLDAVFGMTAGDWSDLGAYWNGRMMSDYTLATTLGDRMEHYKAAYKVTDDADMDLAL